MKKTILFLVILALVVPTAALAKTEFSLGGFIKLDAFWDSTQEGKNMNNTINRNNTALWEHGRMKFTAQGSRFNFTIKGPKVFGAQTTGFIEMDFDAAENGVNNAANSASASYTPRLRHAMFRFNWPETELLFGQYWSMFCDYWSELAQDGPLQVGGTPTARLAQIRLTQKFMGTMEASVLIGESNSVAQNETYFNAATNRGGAEVGEVPQVQGKFRYEADLWGKAAYYGKPRGLSAQVTAGWQRNPFQQATWNGVRFFGNAADYVFVNNLNTHHQYLDPWMVMGSLFIPVIPTHSANLAGTASLLAQWWIGQGVEAYGFTGTAGNLLRFSGIDASGRAWFDYELLQRFGGFLQAEYYFNNQWFLAGVWSMSKVFGLNNSRDPNQPVAGNQTVGFLADQMNYQHEFHLCLWYRPIQAVKFGLQYSYLRTNWMNTITNGSWTTDLGEAHRVEFVGFFYF